MAIPNHSALIARARNIKLEVIVLLVSIAFSALSYVYSYYQNDPLWFSRSGSVVVILSVWVQFRNFSIQQSLNSAAQISLGYVGGSQLCWEMPLNRKNIDRVTVVVIVSGTLIWGYGDLLRLC